MKNILSAILLLTSINAIAATTSYRNTTANSHYLGAFAIHIIYTNPIQANQPVYAWRTHTNFDYSPGIHSQNGNYIGTTDSNGVLSIVVPSLPIDPIHCGRITESE